MGTVCTYDVNDTNKYIYVFANTSAFRGNAFIHIWIVVSSYSGITVDIH